MKKLCAGVLLLLSIFFCQNLKAARFWISAASSNWNNTANWSATSGGAGGASVPLVGDDVNFDGLSAKTLDVSGLPAGIYFIHVLFPFYMLTKTVVISR